MTSNWRNEARSVAVGVNFDGLDENRDNYLKNNEGYKNFIDCVLEVFGHCIIIVRLFCGVEQSGSSSGS